MASAVNLDPRICCTIEYLNDAADHTGVLDDPSALSAAGGGPHAAFNRDLISGKEGNGLVAIGNKFPGYFMRWDGILDEIGDPVAIVMLREPIGVITSWGHRVRNGSFPASMISAYAAFDIIEMACRATASRHATRTLLVSYSTALQGNRCNTVYESVLNFLGSSGSDEMHSVFRSTFANNAYVAQQRPPTAKDDEAIAATIPLNALISEVDDAGCLVAWEATTAAALPELIRQSADAIISEFTRSFLSSPSCSFQTLAQDAHRRSRGKDSAIQQIAHQSTLPMAKAIAGVTAFRAGDFGTAYQHLQAAEPIFSTDATYATILSKAKDRAAHSTAQPIRRAERQS